MIAALVIIHIILFWPILLPIVLIIGGIVLMPSLLLLNKLLPDANQEKQPATNKSVIEPVYVEDEPVSGVCDKYTYFICELNEEGTPTKILHTAMFAGDVTMLEKDNTWNTPVRLYQLLRSGEMVPLWDLNT